MEKKHTNKPQIKVGDVFETQCFGPIEVISYTNANKIGVRFSNGYERSATSGNIQKGKVSNPTIPPIKNGKRKGGEPITLGKEYTNTLGYKFRPTEYNNNQNVKVVFESGYECVTSLQKIKGGFVTDMLSPSKNGVGILGVGIYTDMDKYSRTKEYKHWSSMLARCYDDGYKDNFPAYKNVTMCAEWLNFQTFSAWCNTQKSFHNEDFVLDKDIYVKGNKHYSPETCMFVPYQINGLFTKADTRRGEYPIGVYYFTRAETIAACLRINGVNKNLGYFSDAVTAFEAYKKAKEGYIRDMAETYKEVISEKCYRALYDYQVEITD
jgi:hypothetical protein